MDGQERYIYIAPNGDGRWKLWGSSKDGEWTEELYPTLKQARRNVAQYARLLGWERFYQLSIDN